MKMENLLVLNSANSTTSTNFGRSVDSEENKNKTSKKGGILC